MFTKCNECNRGGNGNAKDKCSCGWNITKPTDLGCFLGTPIVVEIKPQLKTSRSKERYLRFLEYGDGMEFIDYCRWDADKERSWNNSY